MLEIDDLTLAYGVNRVVRGVSMSVGEGEVCALLGPNGAGKTSILRAISGLMQPVGGQITFEGTSLLRRAPDRIVLDGIAHVPEGRRIFPEMSVLDNLLVGATVHIRERQKTRELIERNYAMFPILEERARQAGGTLSGGEQQQLTIARGLMAQPRLLMVDEPTLGLAPAIINTLVDTFRALKALGLTIIVAEQNADFALRVADNGVVLSGGEVSFRGTVDALGDSERLRRAYLGA
ncbi:MAG: ABC transporter ATP-binding protein [Rhodospirillales bacterium]|nr:ABC transporter ATP-binding protein [Rhodospirillales bacterium]MDE0380260.1 ABC transporter ATP-binding protein [Rhodospirillales bacterium]